MSKMHKIRVYLNNWTLGTFLLVEYKVKYEKWNRRFELKDNTQQIKCSFNITFCKWWLLGN